MVFAFNPSFVEIYDNALTKRECDILINYFENSPSRIEGRIFSGDTNQLEVVPSVKKCIELSQMKFSNGTTCDNILSMSLQQSIKKYRLKYPQLQDMCEWKVDDEYTFKKYESKDDGFKSWHTEHGPPPTANRVLVWMFYLNNAQSGTDFMNFSTVKAKRGRCVIWPAFWTHYHRSTLNKGLKYITSGWMSFDCEK